LLLFVSYSLIAQQSMVIVYLIVCGWAFYLVYNRPVAAVVLILAVFLIYELLRYTPHFEVGPFNIYLADILAVIFAGAAVLRILFSRQNQTAIKSYPWKLFVIFSLLVMLSILRGLPYYGQTSIVHARPHIFEIAAAAYFCTFRFDKLRLKRIFSVFIIFAMLLLAVAYLSWLGLLPRPAAVLEFEGTRMGQRVLDRQGGFFLAFAMFALIISKINGLERKGVFSWIMIIALLLTIVLDQVRTIWVVTFAGFIVLMFRYRLRFIGRLFGLFILLLILVPLVFLCVPQVAECFGDYLYESASVFWQPEHTTLSWRIISTAACINQMSLKDFLLGVPFGTPTNYQIYGQAYQTGIHNMFLEQMYYSGVFGLAAFVLLQIYLIRKANRASKEQKDKFTKNVLVILWLTLICYQINFLAWTMDPLYSIIVGISISIIAGGQCGKIARPVNLWAD